MLKPGLSLKAYHVGKSVCKQHHWGINCILFYIKLYETLRKTHYYISPNNVCTKLSGFIYNIVY